MFPFFVAGLCWVESSLFDALVVVHNGMECFESQEIQVGSKPNPKKTEQITPPKQHLEADPTKSWRFPSFGPNRMG